MTCTHGSSLENDDGESIYDSDDGHLVPVNLEHATRREHKTPMEIFNGLFLCKKCHKGESAKRIHRKIYRLHHGGFDFITKKIRDPELTTIWEELEKDVLKNCTHTNKDN